MYHKKKKKELKSIGLQYIGKLYYLTQKALKASLHFNRVQQKAKNQFILPFN